MTVRARHAAAGVRSVMRSGPSGTGRSTGDQQHPGDAPGALRHVRLLIGYGWGVRAVAREGR